ncbi:hypothetical protein LTR81_023131 [Elasticomyces elasticus]
MSNSFNIELDRDFTESLVPRDEHGVPKTSELRDVDGDARSSRVSPTRPFAVHGPPPTASSSQSVRKTRSNRLKRVHKSGWLWHGPTRSLVKQCEFATVARNTAPGHATMAAVQASVPAFMQFRRFGYLRMRMLLALQQEITDLEYQLEMRDTTDLQAPWKAKEELLLAIEGKVLRYGQYFHDASR